MKKIIPWLIAGLTFGLSGGAAHAWSYTVTDLGGNRSVGHGINAVGQAAGYSYISGGWSHAFLYSNGTMTDLGTLGGTDSMGYDVNIAGQVTGYSSTGIRTPSGDIYHAFLYSNGAMTDLGALEGGNNSMGMSINDSGQVSGFSGTGGDFNNPHAFLYSNGIMNDLGTLSGSTNSYGHGINSAGQVVGMDSLYYGSGVYYRAFLYSNGSMTDLNTLIDPAAGWSLTTASDINDAGQIVGYGSIAGETRAFLLTPVPEPETYAMFLAGLVLVGHIAGRRKVV